jgi:phosphoribosylanthranilate isomerase
MAHTIVKICGITRLEDARHAIATGADWIGFVLQGESPRRIPAGRVRAIVDAIGDVVTVGVMVTPTPEEALLLARESGVTRIQLHGVDPAGWPAEFPLPVAFAVPVAEDGALMTALPRPGDLVLLDTAHAQLAGGTGRTFPWFVAATVAADFSVMVAGGLDGGNVGTMLEEVRPFGVDASSRLESAPGVKDPSRVERFIAAVRAHDLRRNGGEATERA